MAQMSIGWFLAIVSLPLIHGASPELVLYEHADTRGAYRTLRGPTPNFVDIGFNDVVTSISAVSGNWELYSDVNYEGPRMVISEGQRSETYENDYYSSGRPVCTYVEDPTTALLRVWEHSHQQGASKDILVGVANIGDDWNDRISSVYAEKGDWELYEHENYEGLREIVREGQQFNIARNDFYSSVRPICETYSSNAKCQLKKLEVIDNGQMEPQYEGTQILGSVSGGSCRGPASHSLTLTSADSVEESFSLEISESEEVNWHVSASVEVEAAAKFLGSGGSVTVGVEVGAGGSHTVGRSETKSYSSGNEQLVGQTTTYTTPGAALVFGVVDRYTIDKSDTPVKMHMECPDGDTFVKTTSMKMQSVKYQSAHFWPLVGVFTREACAADGTLPDCVRGVMNTYSHFLGRKDVVGQAFDNCFANGKGSTSKR